MVNLDSLMFECPAITLPTFEELRDELLDSFEYIDGVVESGEIELHSVHTVNGQYLTRYQLIALEYMEHCDERMLPFIEGLISRQPVYANSTSNYEQYAENRVAGRDPFFGLTDALAPYAYREAEVVIILHNFGKLTAYTINLFVATSYTPTLIQVEALLVQCVACWKLLVEKFIGAPSRSLREHLATVNIRGVTEALVHRCREILQQHPASQLGWHLCVWLHERAVAAFEDLPGGADWARQVILGPRIELGPLIDLPNVVVLNYILPGFEELVVDQRLLDDVVPPNFQDVTFRVTGSMLDPLDYADHVEVPDKDEQCVICYCEFGDEVVVKPRVCNHTYHLECLRSMINRIDPSANLCPLDRLAICPQRPREVVENEPENGSSE